MMLLTMFLFTQQYQALFYECSAKTGCNMEVVMSDLAGYGNLISLLCVINIIWILYLYLLCGQFVGTFNLLSCFFHCS